MSIISLQNKKFKIDIYNPCDSKDAHFGTRYNHCGYIKQITLKESLESLLASPRAVFDAFSGDGFPDEFEKPVNYDIAKMEDGFVKIGVGVEKKLALKEYTNWDLHPIIKKADSSYKVEGDTASFLQKLDFEDISYVYEKIIKVTEDGFNIKHSIKNVGKAQISSMWYSHCFLGLAGSSKSILSLPKNFVEKCVDSDCGKKDGAYIFDKSYDENGKCYNWSVPKTLPNEYTLEFNKFTISASCNKPCYEFQLYINEFIISPEPKINFVIEPNCEYEFTSNYIINKK